MAYLDIDLAQSLYDGEAEVAVIGGCLLEKVNLLRALDRLTPDDFYGETRRLVYRGISEVFQRDKTLDVTSLLSWLKDHSDDHPTADEIARAMSAGQAFWNFDRHVETVKGKSIARQFVQVFRDAKAQLIDGGNPTEVICQALEKGSVLLAASDQAQAEHIGAIALRMGDEIDERYNRKGTLPGISSGLERLDRLTFGWGKRQPYIVIAARPSVGKTTFALNLAFAAAHAGKKVRFFSIEMDRESISEMAISLIGGIENLRLRTGNLSDTDLEKLGSVWARLQETNLIIDDTPEITVQQMRVRTQRQIMDQGCDLIVIDYLQIIKGGKSYAKKYDEVTAISGQLRAMGRALRVPMIVLSQLNRETEKRGGENKVSPPTLADLRETGAIEQDADVVGLLWDPDAKTNAEEEIRPASGPINLRIAKNRRGLQGNVHLIFDRNYCMFREAGR
jgi:replicative DNA helicase